MAIRSSRDYVPGPPPLRGSVLRERCSLVEPRGSLSPLSPPNKNGPGKGAKGVAIFRERDCERLALGRSVHPVTASRDRRHCVAASCASGARWSNHEESQPSLCQPKKGPNKGPLFWLAEREGFEPSVRFEPYTRFPGVHLKPLGHLSCMRRRRITDRPCAVKTTGLATARIRRIQPVSLSCLRMPGF